MGFEMKIFKLRYFDTIDKDKFIENILITSMYVGLFVFIPFLTYFIWSVVGHLFLQFNTANVSISTFIVLIFGIFIAISAILVAENLRDGSRSEFDEEYDVRQKSNTAIKQIDKRAQEVLSAFTTDKVREIIKEEISDRAIGELVATTDRAVWDKYLDQRIEGEIDALRDNLTEWLRATTRSSRTNYFIALIFASSGVVVAATLLFPQFNNADLRVNSAGEITLARDVLFILLPRALLIIALELVAIHFFRLHLSAKVTARYVRDEINTLRFKTTAFYAALRADNKTFLKEVIERLLNEDRQVVMDQGQSTVGLERAKLEEDGLVKVMGEFTSTMKSLQSLVENMKQDKNTRKNEVHTKKPS